MAKATAKQKAAEDSKQETVSSPSNAQLDLERRSAEGYVPDSAVGGTAVLNPNPFGAEEYVGVDPIYQNYANDVNKPLAAESGVEADQLEAHKEMHELDEDDENVVVDQGLGGKAAKAASGTGGATFRTVLPGQEDYDRKAAEAQQGPPLRVYNDED